MENTTEGTVKGGDSTPDTSTNASSSTSSTPPPKGKSSKTVLIIVGVIVVLLLLCACGVGAMFFLGVGLFSEEVSETAVENVLEEAIESESEGDVDVEFGDESLSFESDEGSFEFGTSSEWPDNMPSDVPEFEYGEIDSVITSTDEGYEYWSVGYSDVDTDAADKYLSDLEDEGWVGETTGSYDAVEIAELTKGSLTMVFSYDSDSDAFSIVVEREL